MKFLDKGIGFGRSASALVAAIVGVGLIYHSDDLAQGIAQGLRVSGGVLIPSLFPFMILSTFIVLTGASRILSLPLRPLTKHLFRLPQEHGAVVFISLIGGYPVGAKMISELIERGRLDKPTAERMIAFCFTGSPAFIITAVGAGILFDRSLGIALYCAQVIASLAVGFILSRSAPRIQTSRVDTKTESGARAFVSAVTSSCLAMLHICAFATLLSGLLFMLRGMGFPVWLSELLRIDSSLADAIASGFFEVVAGCISAAQLDGGAIVLISIFCSWGGLSSIFQVVALLGETKLRWRLFFVGRVLHCIFAAILSFALHRAFFGETFAMAQEAAPIIGYSGNRWLIAVCLLAMCTMLTASAKSRSM